MIFLHSNGTRRFIECDSPFALMGLVDLSSMGILRSRVDLPALTQRYPHTRWPVDSFSCACYHEDRPSFEQPPAAPLRYAAVGYSSSYLYFVAWW